MDMKWKIDDDYTIMSDKWSFSLVKAQKGEINNKTGRPNIHKGEWNYSTINLCLKKYVQESLKMASDIKEVIYLLEILEEKIDALEFPTLYQIKSKALLASS
jgi:hypothetical protein